MMKEKIAFRVDAGQDIGFGHLKRCLVLAKEVKKRMDVLFISKNEKKAVNMIKEYNFRAIKLDKRIDKKQEINKIKELISAHSINKIFIDLKEKVGKGYINKLKKTGAKTILLDNTGEGRLEADIVIYPVAHYDKEAFKGIKGKLYYGWNYVIVDKKFFGKRRTSKDRTKILVSMGGSDVYNVTPKIINALKKIDMNFECTVIIGPGFRDSEVKVEDKRFIFKKNVGNIAELMLNSDIGVILFGVSAYEAAAARLPCVLISDSARNKKAAERFKEFGTSIYLGNYNEFNKDRLELHVKNLLENATLRRKMQRTADTFLKRENLLIGSTI